jgi:hypothetical protein
MFGDYIDRIYPDEGDIKNTTLNSVSTYIHTPYSGAARMFLVTAPRVLSAYVEVSFMVAMTWVIIKEYLCHG